MGTKVTGDRLIELLPFERKRKDIFKRRLNKLKNDPIGFIEGSVNKRSTQLREHMPIKYSGTNNFTVVSAVYNVEKYLNDYFKSLTNQSLSFRKHIKLILVDDGSTDKSAAIIKKWQKKYPDNISYIYKENGGQASARNLGLQYLKTEWVTFIDPDDYVDTEYFRQVDSALINNGNVSMVVSNLKFYMEKQDVVKNTHPLRHRFKKRVNKVKNDSLDDNINLSSAASFFKKDYLEGGKVLFSENVKPNFEDGKLIADYLLATYECESLFVRDAVYFYRKREDSTSTLDNSWKVKEKYSNVFEYGFLDVLNKYKNTLGYVPKNIQNTILYDLVWYTQYLLNKPEKLGFLSPKERECFYSHFKTAFSYIDEDVIFGFKMAGAWYFHKVGLLGAFKGVSPNFKISYIEKVDKVKKQVLVSNIIYFDSAFSFMVNGNDVIPKYTKAVKNTLNEELFVKEVHNWIPYNDLADILQVKSNDVWTRISVKGQMYTNGVSFKDIISAFNPTSKYRNDDVWLLMDRETKADDNAEHFYRYMMRSHPEQLCFFALNRDSSDWNRLEKEGFNLVEFGTDDFEQQLRRSSKIISSHLEAHINNYFGDNYAFSKQFIFLQHGVIKHNLSSWINTKKNINTFITTTKDEYNAVTKTDNYKLTEKEVALTGLPRHDTLLADSKGKVSSKKILIMPTWRNYIVGETVGAGSNTRSLNQKFFESNYARSWKSLLKSNELYNLANKHEYQIVFAPHANIAPYLDQFDLPDYIQICYTNNNDQSIQDLFLTSKVLITDYSSITFEMAILNKAILYYQFDRDEMFSGEHTVQKGYFSYEQHGFGPVAETESALLKALNEIVSNNGEALSPYKERIHHTFPFRDGKNCQRVYDSILDLDRPDTSVTSVEKIMEYAEKAITHEAWDLALERIGNALQHSDITQAQAEEITQIKESVLQTGYQNKPVKLANILWQEGRVEEALDALKQIDDIEASDELLRLRVKLAILNNDFVLARDSQKLLLENYNEQCTTEDWQFYTQLASI
ncbi:CDP-glycerol:glycerophosphate glycerophosphotransferase [Psychrobacter celer]|uniref:CDP-glycerol:glycerophosphate glycerophosphotransferase n=1 Tax=Psychrobacter celer TaxID=306572 RepID=UPI003FD0DB66